MATSGTTTFDLDIDDIIQEAYERTGARTNSGYDLKSARRSLNILFSEWGNRGVHLWKVALQEQLLTAGTQTYAAPTNANDILEAYISTTTGTTSSTNDYRTTSTKTDSIQSISEELCPAHTVLAISRDSIRRRVHRGSQCFNVLNTGIISLVTGRISPGQHRSVEL